MKKKKILLQLLYILLTFNLVGCSAMSEETSLENRSSSDAPPSSLVHLQEEWSVAQVEAPNNLTPVKWINDREFLYVKQDIGQSKSEFSFILADIKDHKTRVLHKIFFDEMVSIDTQAYIFNNELNIYCHLTLIGRTEYRILKFNTSSGVLIAEELITEEAKNVNNISADGSYLQIKNGILTLRNINDLTEKKVNIDVRYHMLSENTWSGSGEYFVKE